MDDTRPLDQPQEFADATSYEVRDRLEELVRRDLLGPWHGEREELVPSSTVLGPRDRYLVGQLGPRHVPRSVVAEAPNVPDTEIGVGGDATESELPEVQTPQNLGRIWASSMGLRFVVAADVDIVVVTANWGRYIRRQVEDEDEKRKTVWAREPVEHVKEIPLGAPPREPVPLDPGIALDVSVTSEGDQHVVEMALVNAQPEPESNKDIAWLFQARLTVTALDGDRAIFRAIDDLAELDPTDDAEEAHLRLLYRDQRKYAVGRNIAVHAHVREGQRLARRLETTWLPTYNVPTTEPPTGADSGLTDVELSMDALADAEPERLRDGLLPLVDGYRAWLDEREAALDRLDESLRETARTAIDTARAAATRLRAGVGLLTDPKHPRHDEALRAFRFANRAMADQRRHTEIGRRRDADGLSYEEAEQQVRDQGAKHASWRPFQLAFVLLNLAPVTDPEHTERAANDSAIVDLLFFPTGGGKTEAYLGLTAYTFAIRRLQGTVGDGADARSGEAGVAVLMRYTLRLLTAQQFQRAAALICAAELLRQQDEATWGTTPFRIGLWVGSGVSPNWYEHAEEQIAEARSAGKDWGNVLQTLACPWCGTPLRSQHDLRPDADLRRILLHCPNGQGANACPFSKRRNAEGLPILTVDEEIYRYAPSLVIATVDKLAQLSWRGHAGILFGRVRELCPRHGYRHADLDAKTGCRGRHNARGRNLPAVRGERVTRLRPPDLIVQDELHLISGALGTTVGLFEAAVDELCTWRPAPGRETGPKIIASTATTKRAHDQVCGIFARRLAVFPPPVVDITDTFFSRQVPVSESNPGRRYLGVCAHGTRLKAAEIRLAEILLLAGQTLFDEYGDPADPYLTVVGYFNATRELAGMRRLLDDDVVTRVRDGRRKGLSDRLRGRKLLNVEELTSRISSGDISAVLKRLEVPFNAELDTSARREAIAEDFRSAMADAKSESGRRRALSKLHRLTDVNRDRQPPADVVLATSMLQVGVDVSRFGLMVVTGQPKNTAEYIQATSRVGRDRERPGLVVTLYNWSRPRDLAHYEDFEHYHATFYRQVEALSVTPYTRRSLDRGTTAAFVAAVRQSEEAYSGNADAHEVDLRGDVVERVASRMLTRAETVAGPRGREYLGERLERLRDLWEMEKQTEQRLGYDVQKTGKQQIRGLLRPAGKKPWDDLTVGRSMRETENEINLVLPGGGAIFTPTYNAPSWSFAIATDGDGSDGESDE